jgi:hypothetical protein
MGPVCGADTGVGGGDPGCGAPGWGPFAQDASTPHTATSPIHLDRVQPALIIAETFLFAGLPQ